MTQQSEDSCDTKEDDSIGDEDYPSEIMLPLILMNLSTIHKVLIMIKGFE
jgi:hypothetical protein